MRKLCWLAAPWAGALLLAQFCLPRGTWLLAGGVCALLALLGFAFLKDRRRLAVVLAAAGSGAAFLWCWGYAALFYAPALQMAGEGVPFSAQAAAYPADTAYGQSIVVRVFPADGPSFRAKLYLDELGVSLRPGDRLTGRADFSPADSREGEKITYYTSKGIYLTGTHVDSLKVTRPARPPLSCLPGLAAQGLRDSVDRCFSGESAAFLKALLTGDRTGLSDSLSTALARSGLSHVVAVSGMHVSFLVGLFGVLCRNRRRYAFLCLPGLVLFAGMAGFTPSVVRACVMQSIVLFAPLVRRESDSPTALAAALLLLTAENPLSIAGISFQLSFASVAGILLFSPRLYARFAGAGEKKFIAALRRWLGAGLATTLGAMAFTVPLTLLYFGTVSLVAPAANLLALGPVAVTFALGLAAAVLGLIFPAAAGVLALPVELLCKYLVGLCRFLDRLPFAALDGSNGFVRIWLCCLGAAVVLLLLFPALRRQFWWPAAGVAAMLCLCLVLNRAQNDRAALTARVMDVGEGQCVLFLSQGRSAAVDCGGSRLDRAGDILCDQLQGLGMDRLDLLIFTHLDTDHMNGAETLFARVRVGTVVLPPETDQPENEALVLALAAEQGSRVVYLSKEQTAALGRAELTLMPPVGAGGNNGGLSVRCSLGEFDFLMTGDMDGETEAALVKKYQLQDIEVLVAGHHGSKYSSGETLLAAAGPETAVISVGENRYGHPGEETLGRIGAAGAVCWRTDENGTVTVRVTG